MRHKVIIMYDKGEYTGGGCMAIPEAQALAESRHDQALKAAAEQIALIGPRFFRTIKAQMMRNLVTHEAHGELHGELGESQVWVLHSLTRGKHLTSELARRYNVTNPTMTRIVDALVEKGYVERRPDAEDRRCIFLQLTGQGLDLGKHIDEHFHDALVQFLNPLTEEQLDDIRKAYLHLGALLSQNGYDEEQELEDVHAALGMDDAGHPAASKMFGRSRHSTRRARHGRGRFSE